MTIETKFNINDLVQHKFQKPIKDKVDHALAYEVIDIHSNSCYAGTQVFYDLRAIHGVVLECRGDNFKKIYNLVDFGAGRGKDREYVRFREDELIICDPELKILIEAK